MIESHAPKKMKPIITSFEPSDMIRSYLSILIPDGVTTPYHPFAVLTPELRALRWGKINPVNIKTPKTDDLQKQREIYYGRPFRHAFHNQIDGPVKLGSALSDAGALSVDRHSHTLPSIVWPLS